MIIKMEREICLDEKDIRMMVNAEVSDVIDRIFENIRIEIKSKLDSSNDNIYYLSQETEELLANMAIEEIRKYMNMGVE